MVISRSGPEVHTNYIVNKHRSNEESTQWKELPLKVDVIIPVKNTGPYWRECLESVHREIPVNRLLIGDGGCTDFTIQIAKEYPNVTVLDHSTFKTLGYSIRRLIEAVETEWFVYLHSDVLLPPGWFEEMSKCSRRYDWFECERRAIFPPDIGQELREILTRELVAQHGVKRAYSGSQMGKTKVLKEVVSTIEDDYIERTEDILIQQRVEMLGYRYGKVPSTYHLHYLKADIILDEGQRVQTVLSYVKYLQPTRENRKVIHDNIDILRRLGVLQPYALDVGCGERPQGTINIDVRKTKSVNIVASATHLPFRDAVFQLVFCSEVLEHLKNAELALSEISRVMANGGLTEITVPTRLFSSNFIYHLLRFFLNTLLCFNVSVMGRDVKWLFRDLRKIKHGDVARAHISVVTAASIGRHLAIARQEPIGGVFLASLEARINEKYRKNLKIGKLRTGVMFVCRK